MQNGKMKLFKFSTKKTSFSIIDVVLPYTGYFINESRFIFEKKLITTLNAPGRK